MRVREVMNKPVQTVRADNTLAEAGRKMGENDCGVLPVVDENDHVVGVLTDRDICVALAARNRPASEIPASEAMSAGVFACRAEDDLQTALATMKYRLVRRLPVLDDRGQLVGILSIDDVIIHAGPAATKPPAEVTYGEAFSTLKAICGIRPARKPLQVSP